MKRLASGHTADLPLHEVHPHFPTAGPTVDRADAWSDHMLEPLDRLIEIYLIRSPSAVFRASASLPPPSDPSIWHEIIEARGPPLYSVAFTVPAAGAIANRPFQQTSTREIAQ